MSILVVLVLLISLLSFTLRASLSSSVPIAFWWLKTIAMHCNRWRFLFYSFTYKLKCEATRWLLIVDVRHFFVCFNCWCLTFFSTLYSKKKKTKRKGSKCKTTKHTIHNRTLWNAFFCGFSRYFIVKKKKEKKIPKTNKRSEKKLIWWMRAQRKRFAKFWK